MSEPSSRWPHGVEPGVALALAAAVAEAEPRMRDAVARLLREARATLDQAALELKVKAWNGYVATRAKARAQRAQTVSLVRRKPTLALATAAGVGLLIGCLIAAPRTQVIYLKDER